MHISALFVYAQQECSDNLWEGRVKERVLLEKKSKCFLDKEVAVHTQHEYQLQYPIHKY